MSDFCLSKEKRNIFFVNQSLCVSAEFVETLGKILYNGFCVGGYGGEWERRSRAFNGNLMICCENKLRKKESKMMKILHNVDD